MGYSGYGLIPEEGEQSVSDSNAVKVLVVDDSKTMIGMVAAHLKNTGFEVVATASCGREALEKYQEHRPHLVLLDIVMPEENGLETLQRILRMDSAARVVMVSSLGTEVEVRDCLRRGAKSFLQKPLVKDRMLAILSKVCGEAGSTL
jgi:two-component system chemotaxis response regulator CheY